jgi:hypothetical protein
MSETLPATKDRVLVEVTIPAPVEEVWRALREPEQIRRWFGWDADSLADEIDYIFISHAEASDAEHVIRFDEWGGVSDRFELETRGAGTVLRVVRSGQPDQDWSNVYEEMTEGWIAFVEQLRLALARHAGEERRTVYMSGGALAEGAPTLSEAAGVADLRRLEDGAGYRAEAAGETIAGEVWHRSPFQLGMTVKGWGEGLLIVTDKPANDQRPFGGGSLILTTYGLSDDEFGALETRWRDWWSARYNSAGGEDSC